MWAANRYGLLFTIDPVHFRSSFFKWHIACMLSTRSILLIHELHRQNITEHFHFLAIGYQYLLEKQNWFSVHDNHLWLLLYNESEFLSGGIREFGFRSLCGARGRPGLRRSDDYYWMNGNPWIFLLTQKRFLLSWIAWPKAKAIGSLVTNLIVVRFSSRAILILFQI